MSTSSDIDITVQIITVMSISELVEHYVDHFVHGTRNVENSLPPEELWPR